MYEISSEDEMDEDIVILNNNNIQNKFKMFVGSNFAEKAKSEEYEHEFMKRLIKILKFREKEWSRIK